MTTAGPTFSGASRPSRVRSSDHERREGPAAGAGARELLRREIRWLCLDRLAVGAAVLVLVAATSGLPRLAALFARRERKDVSLVHHVAVAVEHDALVHDEGRGNEVGLHAGVPAELDRVASLDLAVDLAVDHDGAAGDVGGDLRGLADDEEVVGGDLAGEGAVETDLTLEAELAFEHEPWAERGVSGRVGGPALVFTHMCSSSCRRRRPGLRNHERRRGKAAMAWRGQTRNDGRGHSVPTDARLHEKDLGPLGTGLEVDGRLVLDLGRPAFVKVWSDQRAVDHEEVAAESGAKLMADLPLCVQQPGVHRGVLVHGDG